MRNNTMASLVVAAILGFPLVACEDTKARQENEQLKAHVAELVKDNGNLGNQVESLTQENAALKQENERLKAKSTHSKKSKTKHHRRTAKRAAASPS